MTESPEPGEDEERARLHRVIVTQQQKLGGQAEALRRHTAAATRKNATITSLRLQVEEGERERAHLRKIADERAANETDAMDALERETELRKCWEEYAKFLSTTMDGPVGVAHVHGWGCPEADVERGQELRDRIAALAPIEGDE